MAKIVTVHGTFAHIDTASDPTVVAGGDDSRQWWQPGSSFEYQISRMVDSDGSSGEPGSGVAFKPFVWNGDNSETSRRRAGTRLLAELKALEAANEKYCVVGHSHGGSVISSALLEASVNGTKLEGLKRWITIGTPFVELRRERFLFLRLPLLLKAMFIASLMLLFMYLFYVVGELLDGQVALTNERVVTRLIVSTALTAMPFLVYYAIAFFYDRNQRVFYRRRSKNLARKQFADRWLAMSHEDDEAVRGLGSLRRMELKIFSSDFAVPAISLLSVFILPLIYMYVVTSPTLMVSIADFLKKEIYQIQEYGGQDRDVGEVMEDLQRMRRGIRNKRTQMNAPGVDEARRQELELEVRQLQRDRTTLRKSINQRYPNLKQIRRAQRFERRFLREDNKLCEGGKLCGGGRNILLNAKLLFHLVTDEVSSLLVDQDVGNGPVRRILLSAVPVLLVPVVFGIVAVIMVFVIGFLARLISRGISDWLDRQTWFEVRRSALGNDTESEVAVGTAPSPTWIDTQTNFLPNAVGGRIAEHSDRAMSDSISKIRSAISEFALNEGPDGQLTAALNYLTWQELIHTSYFAVPEFQKLLARAISETDGFQASTAFKSDPEFMDSEVWLRAIAQAEKN